MYKLFIVDDEPSARYGLRDCFDWNKYGIEVAGDADDGESALGLIDELKPDIVLTDVKMPNMGGIELSHQLRRLYKNIKIIFFSGYDDIEYLKSALKVDAVDYILKPVNMIELADVIEKVIKRINEENEQKKVLYGMSIKLSQSMPLLREKFFLTLIRDEPNDDGDTEEKLKFLDINLPVQGRFCIFIINIDDKVLLFKDMSEKEKQLLSFSVINICQELIDKFNAGYIFAASLDEYVCILDIDRLGEEEKLLLLAGEIKGNLMMLLKISATIGVGKIVQKLNDLFHSYVSAMEAVNQRFFLGKNRVISMDSLETGYEDLYKFDFVKAQKLIHVLKSADEEKVLIALEDLFAIFLNKRSAGSKYYRNVCLQLLLIPIGLLIELDINSSEVGDESVLYEQMMRAETIEEMKDMIIKIYRTVSRLIYEKISSKSKNVIEKIKDIIQEKYMKNITIAEIAYEVYLTDTYVCLIFKQETGETVNEYLTKIRMDKAKGMLADCRNKLYDICYAVGYTDPSYFTKRFKKYTGYSPSEYRDKLI